MSGNQDMTMARSHSMRIWLGGTLLFVACGMFASGCMVTGAMMYKTFGPADVPAVYTLPKGATLILVENYHNPAAAGFDADQIARDVADQLTKHKISPVIDEDKLVALRDADATKYHAMKIQDVGRALGAKQVIYVNLLESGVDIDATRNALHGHAVARVKVVDVATGNSLWPQDMTEGHQLSVDIPYGDADSSLVAAARTQVVTAMSTSIGHLFYAWKPESEGEANAAQ